MRLAVFFVGTKQYFLCFHQFLLFSHPIYPFTLQWPDQIKRQLTGALPGLSQQLRMAPPYRSVPDEAFVRAQHPKMAAVMLLLFEKTDALHLLLTKRVSYPGVHSGQVSFPGGKVEPEDAHRIATALRETEEEVGVPAEHVEILGELTPLYIPPSNFLVDPVVGYLAKPLPFVAQASEVAEILEIPLQQLVSPDARVQRSIPVAGSLREVPGFLWEEHFIWGATAMMLEEFLAVFSGTDLQSAEQ